MLGTPSRRTSEQDLSLRPPVRVVDPSLLRVSEGPVLLEGGASFLVIAGTQQMRDRASISLSNGGLGIRSATRDRDSAFRASKADALATIRERHPSVVDQFFALGDGGFHILPRAIDGAWFRLSRMGRRRQRIATRVRFCSTTLCQGWPDGGGREVQHSTLRSNSAPTSCLSLRRCSVPRAVLSQGFICTPSLRRPDSNLSSSVCCFPDASLPLCVASCRSGRPLDPCGHHRAPCPHAVVLGRRGFPLESAGGRRRTVEHGWLSWYAQSAAGGLSNRCASSGQR